MYAGAGKQEFYPTIFGLNTDDHKRLKAKSLSDRLQEVWNKLREIERTAGEYLKDMDPFSFGKFELEFLKDHPLFDQARINNIFKFSLD